ncbi:MAG: hypothetical protein WAM06_09510 [Methyloceanibacter sp.]
MALVKRSGKHPSAQAIRDGFIAWQCRIRQVAMREQGGRPSPGMRPRVLDAQGQELAPALTVLLIPNEPEESTAFFRFQVMKTPDPRDVYERALTFLQADYFQNPETFSDRLVTVLPRDAALADALLDERACVLEFVQSRQSYRIAAEVRALKSGHAAREAAIWHNRLFNPALPDTVHVLGLQPDWDSARADPAPSGRMSRSV